MDIDMMGKAVIWAFVSAVVAAMAVIVAVCLWSEVRQWELRIGVWATPQNAGCVLIVAGWVSFMCGIYTLSFASGELPLYLLAFTVPCNLIGLFMVLLEDPK